MIVLYGMKRKYGSTLEEVITTGERLAAELNDIVNHDAALEEAAKAFVDFVLSEQGRAVLTEAG